MFNYTRRAASWIRRADDVFRDRPGWSDGCSREVKDKKKLEGVLQRAPSDLVCFSSRSDGNRNGQESQLLTPPIKLPPLAYRSWADWALMASRWKCFQIKLTGIKPPPTPTPHTANTAFSDGTGQREINSNFTQFTISYFPVFCNKTLCEIIGCFCICPTRVSKRYFHGEEDKDCINQNM